MIGKHKQDYTNIGSIADGNGTLFPGGGGRTDHAAVSPPKEPDQGYGGGDPQRVTARAARAKEADAGTEPVTGTEPTTQQLGNSHNESKDHSRPKKGNKAKSSRMHNEYTTSDSDPEIDKPENPNTRGDPQSGSAAQGSQEHRPQKEKKTGGGQMRIASLNMKGGGSQSTEEKWRDISYLMKTEKIDILALQETHLTNENRKRLNQMYEKNIHIISSIDESTPNKMGVAVVLNKTTTKWKDVSYETVVRGRAILVEIPRTPKLTLTCLAIYAPNQPNRNKDFWTILESTWKTEKWTNPTCMLGDFNIVEDSLDRLPAHPDSQNTVRALGKVKKHMNLADGWRRENPDTIDFSFRPEGRTTRSRLDRIYLNEDLLDFSHRWKIERTGIMTDHSMVSTTLMNPWLPHKGQGRYAMPTFLLDHDDLIKVLRKEGANYLTEITTAKNNRTEGRNPQSVHKEFKENIIKKIREYAKQATAKIDKEIARLEQNHTKVLNNLEWDEEKRLTEAAILDERLRELKSKKQRRTRDNTAAKFFLEGEVLRKPWINANREVKPRDLITALKENKSTGPPLARRSDRMANIAGEHHEKIQNLGIPKDRNIPEVLSHIKTKLNRDQKRKMRTKISKEEVREAILNLPNGKAAGLDGIPHEIWKILLGDDQEEAQSPHHQTAANPNKEERCDVTEALTIVYNDIETHGVTKESEFAEGWMCPIYKKGDRTDISNYRPITVLNSDYKIYTKALTSRLTEVAPHLIHNDQAGFMKGRRIEDQTELAHTVLEWGETKEVNGAIICLDQEKAYDRVMHDFLWATLRKFNFPKTLIKTVKSLYANAKTTVMINGEKSKPYQVTRGVRQGDPLSCLLFNLAIESLAQMLRDSNLKGMEIPGEAERLIGKFFADDTTVYLAEEDDPKDLQQTLATWCKASGGKFNIPKTAVIPVGTKTYRKQMIEARQLNQASQPFPNDIKIAQEGEATRLLGAFVGNGTNNPSIWTPTLEQIDKDLARWSKGNPTIDGRRLIIGMVVGGRTQYRACVQGMPPEVETRLERTITEFIWGGTKHPTVSRETLYKPIELGGKKLLDIRSRNEAIEIMKAKRYLSLGPNRPTWAKIADILIGENLKKKWKINDKETYQNVFLQALEPNTRTNKEGIPASLNKMLKTAQKHQIKFSPLSLSQSLKKEMPIWYHTGMTGMKRAGYNSTWAKCQRQKHCIRTVGELSELAKKTSRTTNPNHKPRKNCKCKECKKLRKKGCKNPNKCGAAARKLLDKLEDKWNPTTHSTEPCQYENGGINETISIPFNKTTETKDSLGNGFRVFAQPETQSQPSDSERTQGPPGKEAAYTDGSCINNGCTDAKAGAGVWYGRDDPRNTTSALPRNIKQSNNSGEIMAILIAAENAHVNDILNIHSDSQITIDALTKSLEKWEDNGWIGVENKELLQAAASKLRARNGPTYFTKIKGHSGVEGNEGADQLAKEGTNINQVKCKNMAPIPGYYHAGAKLASVTQALIYKGILERKQTSRRRSTTINLDIARWAIKESTGELPTDERIWTSIKNKDLTKETRAFLWKMIHNAYKIGEYWERIKNYEQRSRCHECDTTESMEHILTECETSGQDVIWNLAKELYETRGLIWKKPSIGQIMGCHLTEPRYDSGKATKAGKRMHMITISESARLIWKLRCEWKISRDSDPERRHTKKEIINKWKTTLSNRIKLDCLASNETRYKNKAIDEKLVKDTWLNILPEEGRPHRTWSTVCRVLVGMGTDRPPGRNR